MENEIKLLARPDHLDALLHSQVLHQYLTCAPIEQSITDTYFDTPKQRLRAHHACLRVRKAGDDIVQTLTVGTRPGAGRHRPLHYESALTGDRPDLPLLRKLAGRKSGACALLDARNLKDRLAPVFSSQVKRTIFPLKLPHGDVIECAVDVGEIIGNGDGMLVCEVALALRSGELAHLFDLALELSAELPLAVGMLSKGDRGYALVEMREFAAINAEPVALNKHMSVECAFTGIVGNCILHIESNAAGVAHCDSEGLHQMRVGLRRLRSALAFMRALIALPEPLRAEMDWLSGQLGAARDWDVFAQTTLADLAQLFPAQQHIAQVAQAALAESAESRRLAAEAVASPRYARLILMITRWRLGASWRSGAPALALARLDAPVIGFARKALAGAHQRLLKRGKQLDGAAPEARHRVRIAAKSTRYASEFFQSLFDPGTVRVFVKRLSGLQDEFGKLNDVAVADRLLSTLHEKRPLLESSASYVRGVLAAGAQEGEHGARKSWRKFAPSRLPY